MVMSLWLHFLAHPVGSRWHLRSASVSPLVIPFTRRTTMGNRVFPVTAARAWNASPSSVRLAPSLLQFLKTYCFSHRTLHQCRIKVVAIDAAALDLFKK